MYRAVNKKFFKKWTRDMAYVLGFFAADGYITINKRGGVYWSIQIVDEELLNCIKKTIRSTHKISIRKSRNKNEKTLFRLQIGSKEMVDDLYRLGMRENKTKSLAVPKVPSKHFSDFVRGYFDGDGNVWIGNVHRDRKTHTTVIQAVFTSCSVNFLKSLHSRLKQTGLKGGSLVGSHRGYSRLQFSVNDSLKLYKIMYNSHCTLFLKRKKVVFEKFIKNALVV